MFKCLILLLISFNTVAADLDQFSSLLNLLDTKTLTKEESSKILENLVQKKDSQLTYCDIDQSLIESSLQSLDNNTNLKNNGFLRSDTKNFNIYSPEELEKSYTALEKSCLVDFVPMIKSIIDTILSKEKVNNRSIMHIAIRIDPDFSNVLKDIKNERKVTIQWHDHYDPLGDDDRYLFALTRDQNLTTMIKHENQEKYIDANRIFLLPGSMKHRTPDPRPGKRIQMSISVGVLPN